MAARGVDWSDQHEGGVVVSNRFTSFLTTSLGLPLSLVMSVLSAIVALYMTLSF